MFLWDRGETFHKVFSGCHVLTLSPGSGFSPLGSEASSLSSFGPLMEHSTAGLSFFYLFIFFANPLLPKTWKIRVKFSFATLVLT